MQRGDEGKPADGGSEENGLTRGDLLKAAAVAAPGVLLGAHAASSVAKVRPRTEGPAGHDVAGMNMILFLTDQQRAIQHFPPGWAERNMPGLTRLERNGLTFDNHCCNSCMCSPARSTLLTGHFPAQHGVKYTLEQNMPADEGYPQVELSTSFKNLASVTAAAGYTPVYKGKFHCVKHPRDEHWVPHDVNQYGFTRWNPPDAGADQTLPEAGGPPGKKPPEAANNDGRFMDSDGSPEGGHEGVIEYLESAAAHEQPFFLVVSLVNPHDVLFYPPTYLAGGYDDRWLQGEIGLPKTCHEDLSLNKPSVQEQFLRVFDGAPDNALPTDDMKRHYLNFYANLMRSSDAYLEEILHTLTRTNLLDDTLVIATADHGEMGLAHGGLRQKNFNFYEETLRVPMVYSNPRLFPRPRRSKALVSHVDFLPTLASLVGAPPHARARWQGIDYSHQILTHSSKPVQDYTVFTFDDWQSGQRQGPYPGVAPLSPAPNHIVSIREERYKLARYHKPGGEVPDQWEMYDLKADPTETTNLAHAGHKRTSAQESQLKRLQRKLDHVEQTRLQPL